MISLPIDARIPEIVEALKQHRNLVLVAEPGAGKTTRVPPALLAAGLSSPERPEIVLLQPRRVAARSAAARIAEEQGWALGGEVGYQVRFENRTGRETRLRVVTEGILNRQLQRDPYLEKVGIVILDEFHERSLHSDLALALLRELQLSVREDLHILVMSATLEAEPVSRFLNDCPVFDVEGRTFPVDIRHADRTLPVQTGPDFIAAVTEQVARSLQNTSDEGHVLVFLPGSGEINRCLQALEPLAKRKDLLLLPLHGSLTTADQDRALRPSDRRKVICATNIAETSLTIDGVTTVIDSGLARVLRYNAAVGLERLELSRISRASAKQRSGRAGRQSPGRCFRLWTRLDESALPEAEEAEIRRVDLSETILLLAQWGVAQPEVFGWFESPDPHRLASARDLLRLLGALDTDGRITELGTRLLRWPLHPRLAAILESALSHGGSVFLQAAHLCALLSEKDILLNSGRSQLSSPSESDVVLRMELLEQAIQQGFRRSQSDAGLDVFAARNAARVADQLCRIARKIGAEIPDTQSIDIVPEILKRLLLSGYPDRVCRRRRPGQPEALMVGGKGLTLSEGTSVFKSELFLCIETRERSSGGKSKPMIAIASGLERSWLEETYPQHFSDKKWVDFNSDSGKVLACTARTFLGLPIEETRLSTPSPDQMQDVLIEVIRQRWPRIVSAQPETEQWLRRLTFLQEALPELEWPRIDDAKVREVIEAAAMGEKDIAAVEAKPLHIYLDSFLDEKQKQVMQKQAPPSVTVPSGRKLRIEYRDGLSPVLEVRIQEIFGWMDTPKLAEGRRPLTLHLLGPNYRPVQVTSDLPSFWKNGYPEVRKELRSRYPKHSWPEDPLTAKPEAKGVSQRKR